MRVWPHLIMACLLGVAPFANAGPAESCDCPKLECEPCFEEQGLTFFSEKCGPDGSQVKSCARPTCVPMAEQPPACKNKAVTQPPAQAPKENAQAAQPTRGREVADVKALEGGAWLETGDGQKLPVVIGTKVHERDVLKTEKNGRVHVEFKDGNTLQVQDDTVVKVDTYETSAERRKALIELMRGRIRNQVKQKYNGQTSQYQVRTKTAVAGVRGTDFIASYRLGEKIETEIKTIEGRVVLANLDYSQSLEVAAGQQAAYVVAANSVFGDEEISEFVARGYMTPVHQLSAEEVRSLKIETQLARNSGRVPASAKKFICFEPKAELNQCAWRCVNNPKGEKVCRTDLPEVTCLRRRCNANGQWAEDTRLPASFRSQCDPSNEKVAPCDY